MEARFVIRSEARDLSMPDAHNKTQMRYETCFCDWE